MHDNSISKKKNILIYNGAGADAKSVNHLFRSLHEIIDPSCKILLVDGEYLKSDWSSSTCLLIIGGGRARPYGETLGTQGRQRILDAVTQGVSYFGICAGSYFGAKITEFERGNSLEIIDPGLGLANYSAQGPAYGLGKFRYQSEVGAEIAKVRGKLSPQQQNVYFNGGGFFVPLDSNEHTEENVLLSYANIPGNPAAAIQTTYGKGTVILSGVHIEFIPENEAAEKTIVEQLSKSYAQSGEIFAKMLIILGVPTAKKQPF